VEDGVTTNEFYYLLLVIGAFGAFALSMLLATIQYKAWLRQTPVHPAAPSAARAEPQFRTTPTARAA
jgi:hypothetical protein